MDVRRTCDVMLILLHSNASKHNGHSQPIDRMRDERKTNSEILVRGLLFICTSTIHSSSRCNESGARDHTDTTLTFQMIIHNNNQPELTEWNAPWKLCGRMLWLFNIETQQQRSEETKRPKHFPVKSISSKVKRNVMVVVLVDDGNMLMRIQRGWCQPMLSSNNNVLVSVCVCVLVPSSLLWSMRCSNKNNGNRCRHQHSTPSRRVVNTDMNIEQYVMSMTEDTVLWSKRSLYCNRSYVYCYYFLGAFIVYKFVSRGVNEVKPKNSWLIEISMMKNNHSHSRHSFSRAPHSARRPPRACVRWRIITYNWMKEEE